MTAANSDQTRIAIFVHTFTWRSIWKTDYTFCEEMNFNVLLVCSWKPNILLKKR